MRVEAEGRKREGRGNTNSYQVAPGKWRMREMRDEGWGDGGWGRGPMDRYQLFEKGVRGNAIPKPQGLSRAW